MKPDEIDIQSVVLAVRKVPEVIALYLTGSVATERATPLSDVDFAVWMIPSFEKKELRRMQLGLLSEFTTILRRDDVDVAILNAAPPSVAFPMLKQAKLLYCTDDDRRVEFEVRVMQLYFDWLPSVRLHQTALRERITTGRFGHGGDR